MITLAQVNKLLNIGDVVFVADNGKCTEQKILGIYREEIRTQDGYLQFCEHGQNWWLTRKVAQEKISSLKVFKYE